jgi:hypothetical protein
MPFFANSAWRGESAGNHACTVAASSIVFMPTSMTVAPGLTKPA